MKTGIITDGFGLCVVEKFGIERYKSNARKVIYVVKV